MTGLGGPCILCGFQVRSRDCCQSRGHWGDGSTPCHVEYYGPILCPCPTCGEPEPTAEIMRDCSLCNPPAPNHSPNDIKGVRIMPKWEPIESAPKDGTAFLAHRPNSGPYFARQDIDVVHYSEWGGGVWEGSRGHAKYGLGELSHWMPLPSPPE